MKYFLILITLIGSGWLIKTNLLLPTTAPLFPQCPAVGLNTGCAVLVTINPDTSTTVQIDPSQGPFDGIEDTLVGVQNNSSQKIFSLSISSPTDIFGFDGDGLCSVSPRPAGCSFGPTGYEGPGVSFSNINTSLSDGFVNFNQGISAGGSAYFSLEEDPSTAQISAGAAISNGPTFLGSPGTSLNPTGIFAEPVNTATGNYYTSHRDLFVAGKKFGFNFTRFYNSRDSYSGPLGAGWTFSYNIFLTENTGSGIVTIKQADGGNISFSPAAGGLYTPLTTGLFDELRKNGNGSFTLTRKNQSVLQFSPSGKLLTLADKDGNTQILTYNVAGRLTSVADTSGRLFQFGYDGSGHLISVTDPIGRILQYSYDVRGNLISYRDASGGLMLYSYDAAHRMLSATDQRGVTYVQNTYDAQGRVILQRNARGYTTTFSYDTPATGTTTITDARGNQIRHSYDTGLRLIQVTNALGGTTTLSYNINNQRTSITNPNGKTTNIAYDANGNITGVTNALGDSIALTYDGRNNLLTATSPSGSSTTFSYNSRSDLISIRDALGNINTFSYDGAGQLTSETNALGNTTKLSYSGAGDLIRVQNAIGNSVNSVYDGIGRLISVTDGNGHTTTLTYDLLSRVTKTTGPIGNQTTFGYDAIGNLIKITDANGNDTSYQYDGTNNLTTVTDALGHLTKYSYDGNNNRLTFTDSKGNTRSYGYDSVNRLTSVTDPLSFVRSYVYDAVGNIVSITDPNGNINHFSYDALNRRTLSAYADGNSISYSYSPDGNRTSMVDSHGMTTYAYDALNRLVSVGNPNGKVVGYGYDAIGHRISLTYPDGKVVNYKYDATNHLSAVTDWTGLTTSYSYDPAGNLIGMSAPNNTSSRYSYDDANQLTSVVNRSIDQVRSFSYVLDKVGNRLQVISQSGKKVSYGYDALYRLTTWVDPAGRTTHYAYDDVGNRISTTEPSGVITNYSYDSDDRLLNMGSTAFTYDANGNRLTKTTAHGTVNYHFDALNRLSSVIGDGVESRFKYDGDGNRVQQEVKGLAFAYLNDTARALPSVLNEERSDGEVNYVYGRSLISSSGTPQRYFYQYDGLGSVVNITNHAGALNASYAYDPWGLPTDPEPPKVDAVHDKNKLRFTGEPFDEETGLSYFRARYYDGSVGRFISPDPFPGFVGSPLTTNRYAYAGNNPLRYTDRTGYLFGVDDAIAAGAGFIGGLASQYFTDVIDNYAAGATGLDLLVPHSGFGDYAVSALGGAVTGEAALVGFELAGPWGAATGGGLGVTLTDIAKSWVDHKEIDPSELIIDATLGAVTAGTVETFPHVPGRWPDFFTTAFFTGAHTQDALLKTAISVGVDVDKTLIEQLLSTIPSTSSGTETTLFDFGGTIK